MTMPMGASRLGQVDRQHHTRQIKENKEDANSSTDKLECQDHVSLLIKRSPSGNVFSSAECRPNRPDSVFVHRGSNQQQEIKTFAVLYSANVVFPRRYIKGTTRLEKLTIMVKDCCHSLLITASALLEYVHSDSPI